jgi:hypothetical protein
VATSGWWCSRVLTRKDTAMNVTEMLGLQDERMEALVEGHWAAWADVEPRLAKVGDPLRLDGWRRKAAPDTANAVLLGLAHLAAFDGGDDTDAALVLAWLLLPTALRVRRTLWAVSERIDEVVAAQLWVEVRSLPWRRQHWVAAKVATRLREGVLLECGMPTHHKPARLAVVSLGPVDPADDRRADADDAGEELADLLAWACAEDVISLEDRELLVSLIAAARTLDQSGERFREGGVAGLSSRQVSNVVARERGVCARTVRRHAARCVAALTGAAADFLNAVG